VFRDWETLCWKYIQQPPEWVDWLIQGIRVTSEEVVEADKLVAAAQAAAAKPVAAHRRPTSQEQQNKGSNTTFTGRGRDYLLRRIARDQPDLLGEIGHGKRFKSARAAAIEAGIITPFPSLQLKEPLPTAQKLLAKKGQEWCLQLMEELSSLIIPDC
jgi:hypothetical protein